jgi:hypothetical protein
MEDELPYLPVDASYNPEPRVDVFNDFKRYFVGDMAFHDNVIYTAFRDSQGELPPINQDAWLRRGAIHEQSHGLGNIVPSNFTYSVSNNTTDSRWNDPHTETASLQQEVLRLRKELDEMNAKIVNTEKVSEVPEHRKISVK